MKDWLPAQHASARQRKVRIVWTLLAVLSFYLVLRGSNELAYAQQAGSVQMLAVPQASGTIADNFDNASGGSSGFTGSDGTLPWLSSWQNSSNIFVQSFSSWCKAGYCLRMYGNKMTALSYRQADLSGTSSATLSFDYAVYEGSNGSAWLEISNDGVSYQSLSSLPKQYPATAKSIAIPAAYLTAGFRLRFVASNSNALTDLFIDNIVMTLSGGTPVATFTATAIPATASNTAIPPTATNTAIPPTATNTAIPPSATNTAIPPTATATSIAPTTTNTSLPPTATTTPVPPTATNTSIAPATATTTATPTAPPTATPSPTATATTIATVTPTATSTSPSQAIRFGVIGDFGGASPAEANVANLLASQSVSFVVTVGDNRYGAISYDSAVGRYYCRYMAGVAAGSYCAGGTSAVNAFFAATGNHDYDDGGGITEYLNYFNLPGTGVVNSGTSGSERYYDIVQGPVQFFFIDSNQAILSATDRAAQQAWLQSRLAASTTRWQVVVFHHAAFSSAAHGSTTLMQWPFAAWGADAVLSGHDHTYERILQNNIPYFVDGLGGESIYTLYTPVAGSQVRYNGDYGAMIVDADANTMTFRFLTQANVLIDSYTIGTQSATPTPTPSPVSTATATTPNGTITPTVTATPNGTPATLQTVELRIAQSSDDAEEFVSNGSVSLTSSDLELVTDGTAQKVGLRFNNLQIPRGATIQSAYLEFEVDEAQSEATNLSLRAQDSDNAPTFTSAAYNVSSRLLTAAAVDWNVPAWNTLNVKQRTPDLAALLQAIINRSGWVEGNSIAFVVSGSGHRTAKAYDLSPATAPLLHIEYSAVPVLVNDLIAENLEVTQAIQDLNHSVRLVKDKRTFVRFYARTDQGKAQVAAQLEVQRGNQSTTLLPINGDSANAVGLRSATSRATLDGTFLFELPAGFREGSVTLTGRINPQGTLAESNSGNNSSTVTVSFETVQPIYLVLYSIGYGSNYYPSEYDLSMLESWLRRAYPISQLQVTRRSLYYGSSLPTCTAVDNLLASERTRDRSTSSGIPAEARYYGMVVDTGGFMRGCGWQYTNSGPTGAVWSWDTDGTYGDWYGGHELGHGFLRDHANFCGATGGPAYPYANGQISPSQTGATAIYGFDAATQAIYGPNWTDIMTYCDYEWMSDFTYEAMMSTIQSLPANRATTEEARLRNQTDRLLIAGTIDGNTQQATLDPLFILPAVGEVEDRIPGDYAIVLKDGEGQEVARYAFAPHAFDYGPPLPAAANQDTLTQEGNLLGIHELVPYVEGVTTVEIQGPDHSLLGSVAAKAGKPEVAITAPTAGDIITSDSLDVTWSASDPDGDALVYNLQYSVDQGQHWESIALNLRAARYTVALRQLRRGQDLRFRVWASDGIHTASAEMPIGIALPIVSVTAKIASPLPNATLVQGEAVLLQGSGYALERGTLTGDALLWLSDRDGQIGTGETISTTTLSLGQHIIELRATDQQGNSSSDFIEVNVVESIPEAPTQRLFLPLVSK